MVWPGSVPNTDEDILHRLVGSLPEKIDEQLYQQNTRRARTY
jgi:hypothetical protein